VSERQPRVLVGIIANDSARYSLFASCVTNLDLKGLDAKVEWLIGGDWCGARNSLAQMTLDEGYDYLWFMDDDHAFAPGILKKLLSHGVHLCNPLCTTRVAPFPLVTYTHKVGPNTYLPPLMNGVPEEGLIELEAAGCAGMLIHRQVLEAVERPWFEYTNQSEDIVFCRKAKVAGFKLYADLGARVGHITTAVISPMPNEGKWMTLINVGRDLNLFVGMPDELEGMAHEATADEGGREAAELPPATEPGAIPLFENAALESGESVTLGGETRPFEERCMLCGNAVAWQDVHGQRGCSEHLETHPDWKTHYERAEVWYMVDEGRWYSRLLDGTGRVAVAFGEWSREEPMITAIEAAHPGLPIFHITDEFQDSRKLRQYGPPQRIWDRTVGE